MIQNYYQTKSNRNFSIAMVWINGGSNMDVEEKKGINHILCSLLGRGCKGFESLAFSEYVDSHGAELNFETLEDGILVSLKSLDEHFYKLFPLLDLIINKPLLINSQFQNVKKSTINTLKKEKENPFNITFEKWRKIVYLKHPYAYNTLGYKEDISKITYNDILSEYENFKNRNKYLISNNLIVKNKSIEFFNQKLDKNKLVSNQKYNNVLKRFVSTHQNSNQIILMIGNQTCPISSPEYLPLKILESHLSFGMSSALFKLFREKNGLTYDVGVYNPIRKYNSPFLIYFSVSNENALLAFEILSELWGNLISSLILDVDIYLAKIKLKSSFQISNQTLDDILQRKIKFIGYDLNPDLDCLAKINEITSKDIMKVTKKYFSKPFLSIYGNEKMCNKIYQLWIKNF
ncbi:insulinase family protein [Prochlorococcus sp. AH-716-E13]|nr:insulinase family protein [Prochlorococcus sp. AH-716-E13]